MSDGLFDQFKTWYEQRHEYARAWKKRTGGQVVATMCTYTPEEILIAAGMLPVRVLGAHEPQNVTEPHIFGMFCPFCRDSLALLRQARQQVEDPGTERGGGFMAGHQQNAQVPPDLPVTEFLALTIAGLDDQLPDPTPLPLCIRSPPGRHPGAWATAWP